MADKELKKIDVYLLTRTLGQGGMGIVYEARHSVIGRKCAIKVLHSALESNEILLTRMIREARAASNIGHPNIVEVYDFRKAPDGAYYMVMELLEGISLENLLDKRITLSIEEAAVVMSHILSALQAAHGKGIVHRDLKPDNVFISKTVGSEAVAKVLDFGISKFTRPENTQEELNLTKTGAVLGSPYYMSPEQASGKRDIDTRCDLWACGVILYEMLTGAVPFDGDNYNEVMANILMQDPPKPRELEPGIPEDLEAVILKALSKKREDRFSSASEMLDAIRPFLPEGSVEIEGLALRPAGILTGDSEAEPGGTLHGFTGTIPPGQDPSLSGTRKRSDSLNETQTAGQDISQSIHTLDIRHMSRTRLTLAALSVLLLLVAAGGAFTLMGRSRRKRAKNRASTAQKRTVEQSPSSATTIRDAGTAKAARQGKSNGSPGSSATGQTAARQRDGAGGPGSRESSNALDGGMPGTETKTKDAGAKSPQPPDNGQPARPGARTGNNPPEGDTITVTLLNLPERAMIWLDSKRMGKPPFKIKKDHRQHCIDVVKPGFKRYMRCFFANHDRTYTVHLVRKKRPRNIYESPY